jgi:hypothetical protein
MSDKTVVRVGGGWCLPLLVVFIVLKATGTVDWSWWWVLSPLWLPIAVVLAIPLLIFSAFALVAAAAASVASLGVWALDAWERRR